MNSSDYISHPLRNLLERLTELRNSAEFTDPDLLSNAANAAALETTFATVSVVCSMLEKTPAVLVSEYGLNQLQNSFQLILNELTHYQSNKNHGHIQNAKAHIEQVVMSQLWALGPIPLGKDGNQSELSEIVNQATNAAREALQQLVAQRDNLNSRQIELIQQVHNAETRLESLTETVAIQKAEAASVVAVVQQMYAEKEAERVAAFSTMLQNLREDFANLQRESEKTQAERLEALQASQVEAARIVQVVGNTGITGNYQKIANTEGEQANV